jgi:hypothetical protein
MKTYPIGAAGVPIQLVKPSRSTLRISTYGKGLRVANLYVKGKSFLGAAVLLERNKGNQSVVLHLVCQGLECILKAILLSLDYEMYRPLLKSKFGHKLLLIAETVTSETNTHLRSTTRAELTTLDNLYRQHLLRYDSNLDLLIDPTSVSYGLVVRRTVAAIRLIDSRRFLDPSNFRVAAKAQTQVKP